MSTALVTGASSGIGADLARIHAEKGGDLVVVARRGERLNALKTEIEGKHGTGVRVIEADLGTEAGIEAVVAGCDGVEIDVLVNNAGFGGRGRFHERERADDLAMIDLNVRALVDLTHRFVGPMVARGRGRVLQVGSTAGLMPGPWQATYFATKAFVNSFGQALAEELSGTGVTVTVLAPGAVDTEFVDRAKMRGLEAFKGAKSARSVAEFGYRAMERGELLAINEAPLRVAARTIDLMPRRSVLKLARRFMNAGLEGR